VPPGDASDENQNRLLQRRERQGKYPNVKFDFLGFCFRPRRLQQRRIKVLFCGYNPAVSPSAMKAMRETIRELNLRRQTQLSMQDIARQLNPLLRGWLGYYGRYSPAALYPLLRYVNMTLVACAARKFKRFNRSANRLAGSLNGSLGNGGISSSIGNLA